MYNDFDYSYEKTIKTWNTDFIIICQNLIGLCFGRLYGLVYDLLGEFANFGEKAISILAENLNSGRCYHITTVPLETFEGDPSNKTGCNPDAVMLT